jgi:chromosome segregation ATPase
LSDYIAPAPSGGAHSKIVPILVGAVIALLGANIWLYTQLDAVRNDLAEFRKTMANELLNVKETSSVSVQTARRNLAALRDELEAARRQAAMAAGQAKAEATKRAEELAQRLASEQQKFEKAQEQLKTELTQVGQTATEAKQKLGEVSTEVGSVKTEVAATKSELEKTISELKRVTGDLGVQSGLIATNARELAALKALGERNYYEFNLTKSKQHQKVGNIGILLKNTDPKRNKYTIEVLADDKKVEKKDKTINEPVQFLVAGSRQPYEIVVNEVRKNQIIGYLSVPKVQSARN